MKLPEPAMTYVGPDGEIGYYTESQVQALVGRINELEADAARLQKVCMVIDRHWRQLPAVVCDDFNEAMKGSL